MMKNYFVHSKLQSLAKFKKKNNICYLILRTGEQAKNKRIIKIKVGEKIKKEKFQRKTQVVLVHGKKEKRFDKNAK